MIEFGADGFIYNIPKYWHKKRGLISVVILVTAFCALVISYFDDNTRLAKCYLYSFLLVLIIVGVIWLITTNRWIWRLGKDLVLAIMPQIDDENFESKPTISKLAISKIKEMPGLEGVKIILLPTNFLNTTQAIKNYINRNSSNLDMFLKISLDSGNIDKDDSKTEISEFNFVFNLHNLPIEKEVFLRKINFLEEVNFQNFHKDWSLVNSKSFDDKKKIKSGFEDLLIHAFSIQYILIGKFEKAINLLERLFNKNELQIQVHKDINGKIIKAEMPKALISNLRQLELITSLYLTLALESLDFDKLRTYKYLKKLESIGHRHPYSFNQFMMTARVAYEIDKIDEAILYTSKAEEINGTYIGIHFNHVFLGIIENDWNKVIKSLKKLFHRRTKLSDVVDVLDFLSHQKEKVSDKRDAIEFIIEFYSYIFLKKQSSKEMLIEKFEFVDFGDSKGQFKSLVQQAIRTIKQ